LKNGTAAASPFVIAIQRAGIKGLPSASLKIIWTFALLNCIAGYQRLLINFRMVRSF
jgi:amino acid permease